jgi:hypothetical protein
MIIVQEFLAYVNKTYELHEGVWCTSCRIYRVVQHMLWHCYQCCWLVKTGCHADFHTSTEWKTIWISQWYKCLAKDFSKERSNAHSYLGNLIAIFFYWLCAQWVPALNFLCCVLVYYLAGVLHTLFLFMYLFKGLHSIFYSALGVSAISTCYVWCQFLQATEHISHHFFMYARIPFFLHDSLYSNIFPKLQHW